MHLGRWSAWLFRGQAAKVAPVDAFGFSWLVAVSPRKARVLRVGFSWISLDSLVRNRDFSMGYTGFSREIFSSRFFPNLRTERGLAVKTIRKRRVAHETSVKQILIFRKALSSGPSRPLPPQSQKQLAQRPPDTVTTLPVTKLRGRRNEPGHGLGDLLGSADAAQRRHRLDALAEARLGRSGRGSCRLR